MDIKKMGEKEREVIENSKFLTHLQRIKGAASAGYGDIALLPALVLPDILGKYLYKCENKTSSDCYKKCLQRYIKEDAEHMGFSDVAIMFGNQDTSLIARQLYKLRCSLAHGGDINEQEIPNLWFFLVNPKPITYLEFEGNGSVHPIANSPLIWIDINKLICILCRIFRFAYINADPDMKKYLDDFNRAVAYDINDIPVVNGKIKGRGE